MRLRDLLFSWPLWWFLGVAIVTLVTLPFLGVWAPALGIVICFALDFAFGGVLRDLRLPPPPGSAGALEEARTIDAIEAAERVVSQRRTLELPTTPAEQEGPIMAAMADQVVADLDTALIAGPGPIELEVASQIAPEPVETETEVIQLAPLPEVVHIRGPRRVLPPPMLSASASPRPGSACPLCAGLGMRILPGNGGTVPCRGEAHKTILSIYPTGTTWDNVLTKD